MYQYSARTAAPSDATPPVAAVVVPTPSPPPSIEEKSIPVSPGRAVPARRPVVPPKGLKPNVPGQPDGETSDEPVGPAHGEATPAAASPSASSPAASSSTKAPPPIPAKPPRPAPPIPGKPPVRASPSVNQRAATTPPAATAGHAEPSEISPAIEGNGHHQATTPSSSGEPVAPETPAPPLPPTPQRVPPPIAQRATGPRVPPSVPPAKVVATPSLPPRKELVCMFVT
jgi:alpha,alpha-trehalase